MSWLRLVQESASSIPDAPPNETIGWAPSASAVVISPVIVGSLVTGRVSPQIGVQPLPVTNAALNAFSPACVAAWLSMGSWLLVRSAYGATAKLPGLPPPPPPPDEAVVACTALDCGDSPVLL